MSTDYGVLALRGKNGNDAQPSPYTSGAACGERLLVVQDGTTKKVGAIATNAVLVLGVCMSEATAADENVHVVELGDNVEILMRFTGTWAATKIGTYVAVVVDSDGNQYADVDDAGHDLLKVARLVSNTTTDKRAWFVIPSAKCQAGAEV